MMIWFFLLFPFFSQAEISQKIVLETKQLILPECPGAFNPSLVKTDAGFLLVFRYCPDRWIEYWISYIGIVLLNNDFEPISEPQLLTARRGQSKTSSQSEDPRIFSFRGRTFIVFNDNLEVENPTGMDRRDMHLVELFCKSGRFSLSSPIKLIHNTKYETRYWQKNWFPFEWQAQLHFVFSIDPHEIIQPNLIRGTCYPVYETEPEIEWEWGDLRGSTPALLVDGEYLSFFHSSIRISSSISLGEIIRHYFMGAYTFSPEPPFNITKMSSAPIIGKGFYTPSDHEKRVIFPGGFVHDGDRIYVTYGKDDCEIWIATLDKKALMQSLKPVTAIERKN